MTLLKEVHSTNRWGQLLRLLASCCCTRQSPLLAKVASPAAPTYQVASLPYPISPQLDLAYTSTARTSPVVTDLIASLGAHLCVIFTLFLGQNPTTGTREPDPSNHFDYPSSFPFIQPLTLVIKMADRFPSLEDFDSGGMLTSGLLAYFQANRSFPAQTDIKDTGVEPSADDFLAREKALLGDDADQFATSDDAVAFGTGDDDLLGGGGSANVISEESTFESQFPDLANQNEVRHCLITFCSYLLTQSRTGRCSWRDSRRKHNCT